MNTFTTEAGRRKHSSISYLVLLFLTGCAGMQRGGFDATHGEKHYLLMRAIEERVDCSLDTQKMLNFHICIWPHRHPGQKPKAGSFLYSLMELWRNTHTRGFWSLTQVVCVKLCCHIRKTPIETLGWATLFFLFFISYKVTAMVLNCLHNKQLWFKRTSHHAF